MKFDKLLGITLQSGMKSLYVSRINVLLVSLSFSSLKVSGLPKLYARCLSTESNGISDCYCLPAESMRWCVCDCEVSKNWYLCSSGPSSLSWIMLTEMKYVWGSQKRIHWVLLSFNTSISSWNLECLICRGTRRNILRAMNENQLQSQPVCDSRAWNWTWITKMRGDLLSILFHPGQLHLRQPYLLPTCDLPTHRLIRIVTVREACASYYTD